MKQNNIKLQLKIEKFLTEQLWQYLLVIAFVSFFAWLFNKPFEAVMFCISHLALRPVFSKQYHCDTTYACIFTTLTIAFLGIYTCVPTTISLLSAIPIACFVCWVGYLAQDRVDLMKNGELTLLDLTKEELVNILDNSLLKNEEKQAIRLHIVDGLKGEEFYNAMGYSKPQCWRIYHSAVKKVNKLIKNQQMITR